MWKEGFVMPFHIIVWKTSKLLMIAAIFMSATLIFSAFARDPGVPQLPMWSLIERSLESIPLGTVVIGDSPTLTTAPRENAVDLTQYGYVEEEYLISGTANLYENGTINVNSIQSYATRIIMRRPLDVYKFSGSVHMEPLANKTEHAPTWTKAWPYFVFNGDIWIGISLSKANVESMKKSYDKLRYANLDLPNDMMRWDILAQVAWLMRSAQGPLSKLHYHDQSAIIPGLLRVYISGWGKTGCVISNFLNFGHHQINLRPNGRPIIDGYLSGSCPQEGPLQVPSDAAVMQIISESEYIGPQRSGTVAARQHDGSVPLQRRYRWYDVPGSSHASFLDQPQFSISAFQLGLRDQISINCPNKVSRTSPINEIVRVSLRNLDEWIRIGFHPPEGKVFDLNKDQTIKRDRDGNATGGFRSQSTEVPILTFSPNMQNVRNDVTETLGSDCAQFSSDQTFSPEYIEILHGDRRAYIEKVTDSLILLVNSRRLLEADADAILNNLK